MTVTVATPPGSTALTTLARVKEEILVTSSSHDDFLTRLIDEASETISAWASRPLWRAKFTETRFGNGRETLALSRFPVAALDSVSFNGGALTIGTDLWLEDAAAGLVYKPSCFGTVYEPDEWSFTYTAGWFLAGDDITTSISVDATDDSYNSATSLFTSLLRAGDTVYGDGFTASADNGTHVLTAATTAKLTTGDALTTESAGSRTLYIANLPGWIERACLDLVKLAYHARDRDPALRSFSLGPLSTAWEATAYQRVRSQVSRLASPL